MTDDNDLVIERLLPASVDVVWQRWTDPEQFKTWYGPPGASIPVAEMDHRVGGKRLVCMEMTTPDGPMRMWFAGKYLEIVEGQRLVYTEAMADETGTPSPPDQLPPGHPGATEVRVEVSPSGDHTTMVLTHVGVDADSPGAMGWKMALDKLEARLGSP